MNQKNPRIAILIVAYNAASTLASVLDRIPVDYRSYISEVVISDDSSTDATYLVGLGYKQLSTDLPITVLKTERNLGYGGNQKVGYKWVIENDFDLVVLLHGDGQYAPELLPQMTKPLIEENYDAVFGSRMMEPKAARRGGMPLYKYMGNKILTKVENQLLGTSLTEFHSGYRAYTIEALRKLDFESYSDEFNFDTEIIIDFIDKNMKIKEIPIPTYYGDEICYVNGMRYARQVVGNVISYKIRKTISNKMLVSSQESNEKYPLKLKSRSSHRLILNLLEQTKPSNILDVGCGAGFLAEQMKALDYNVTGIDIRQCDGVFDRVENFFIVDLDKELISDQIDGHPFDVIVLADVLEHLYRPETLLDQLHKSIDKNGSLFVTVPNFSHWYPRFRTTFGFFGYDKRGILDEDHIRFFTRRTIKKLFAQTGWDPIKEESIGVPWENIFSKNNKLKKILLVGERVGILLQKNLFSYQWLFELKPVSSSVSSIQNSKNN